MKKRTKNNRTQVPPVTMSMKEGCLRGRELYEQFHIMMVTVRNPREITQKQWDEKREETLLRDEMLAAEIRFMLRPTEYERSWGVIYQ
jgi:hypothetical protein